MAKEPTSTEETPAKIGYNIEPPAPETLREPGMKELSSAPVISFKRDIPVNDWTGGLFLRTETRKQTKGEPTTILILQHDSGAEFGIGEQTVLCSALDKAGCDSDKHDYKAIVGKRILVQNLGKVAGKRYFNLRVFVQDAAAKKK